MTTTEPSWIAHTHHVIETAFFDIYHDKKVNLNLALRNTETIAKNMYSETINLDKPIDEALVQRITASRIIEYGVNSAGRHQAALAPWAKQHFVTHTDRATLLILLLLQDMRYRLANIRKTNANGATIH